MMQVNTISALAVERVNRAVGPVDGPKAIHEGLNSLGLTELKSPRELLAFAEYLIRRGGVFEAVGRGLKVSALLRGAKAA